MPKEKEIYPQFDLNKTLCELYKNYTRADLDTPAEEEIEHMLFLQDQKHVFKNLEAEINSKISIYFKKKLLILQDKIFLEKIENFNAFILENNLMAEIRKRNSNLAINIFDNEDLEKQLNYYCKQLYIEYLKINPIKKVKNDGHAVLENIYTTIQNAPCFQNKEASKAYSQFKNDMPDEIERHIICIYRLFIGNKKGKIKKNAEIEFFIYFEKLFTENESFFKEYSNYKKGNVAKKYFKEKVETYRLKKYETRTYLLQEFDRLFKVPPPKKANENRKK